MTSLLWDAFNKGWSPGVQRNYSLKWIHSRLQWTCSHSVYVLWTLPCPKTSLFGWSAVPVMLWACVLRGTQPNHQVLRSLFPALRRKNIMAPGDETALSTWWMNWRWLFHTFFSLGLTQRTKYGWDWLRVVIRDAKDVCKQDEKTSWKSI